MTTAAEIPTDRLLRDIVHYGADFGARFSLKLERRRPGPTLVMRGAVLQEVPEVFQQRVTDALVRLRAGHAFVDLTECQDVSSTALAFLVSYHRAALAAGATQVAILAPQPRVLSLLKLLGLTNLFQLVETPAEPAASSGMQP